MNLEIIIVVVHSLSHVQLCDPMDCSTVGFPVLPYLPEFAQTHVHWVGDAIQPSHSLLAPSSPALSFSQHQGLFQWVGSLHEVAKVLELQFQYHPSTEYSGLISFRIDWFDLLASKGLSRVFSNTTIQKHLFFSAQPYGPTLTSIHDYWKNHSFDYMDLCQQSDVSAF